METGEFNQVIQPVFDMTDRSAIMILPKEIYYKWGKCVTESKDFHDRSETEVFLIPGFNSLDQAESFIRNFYDLFFQYELKKYDADPSFWPVNRTFELFQQWFDTRLSCGVSDILAQPILKASGNSIFEQPGDPDFPELEECDILGPGWWFEDFCDPFHLFMQPKPGLCLTCCKDNDQEEEYLCEMLRIDFNLDEEFTCGEYEPLN